MILCWCISDRDNVSCIQGGNNIHEKGVTAIAHVLKDNSIITTVSCFFSFFLIKFGLLCRELYLMPLGSSYYYSILSQLELGYNPIGPEGAKALAEILKFHGKIETLKLGWCQVSLCRTMQHPLNLLVFW